MVFHRVTKCSKLLKNQTILEGIRQLCSANNEYVKIVEVGARDGLQNEKAFVPSDVKVELIDRLSDTGLSVIEATSFVSPKWIPQFVDNLEVMQRIHRKESISYPVLVPNLKGLHAALKADATEVAVFAAASESFSKRNTNCTISESLERLQTVVEEGKTNNINVRGYVSCIVGCPYDGDIDPEVVAAVSKSLYEMGCYEISLGDTIGVGTPESIRTMLSYVSQEVPTNALAIHCHDTYQRALINIDQSLEMGVRTVDSSVGGLGGCPYAKGATGNVSTESVLKMLGEAGMRTNVDSDLIVEIGQWIVKYLKEGKFMK